LSPLLLRGNVIPAFYKINCFSAGVDAPAFFFVREMVERRVTFSVPFFV
jgi:hypothetical protein